MRVLGELMVKIEFLTRLYQVESIRERLDGIPLLEFIVSDAKFAQHGGLAIDVVRGVECAEEFAECAKVEIYARQSASRAIIAALNTSADQRAIAETMVVSAIEAKFEIEFGSRADCAEVAA
jgi:nitrogen regulatory protein PII